MSGPPVLEAVEVTKRFGAVTALDRVTLRVASGERVALVGESGSGKTTLLRCFNRMVRPDEGVVRVYGRAAAAEDPVALRRSMGYAQQEGGLLPHWSVLRNAGTVPWLSGHPDHEALGRDALRLVGLDPDEFGARWPRDLSGGQRQRVALARALASRPGVVLLDEPFGALDAITRSDLQSAFRALAEELGISVVLVTHDLREAFLLADRVVVMRAGRVERVGRPGEIRQTPDSRYVAHLLERAGVAP